jgi:hypothetical protein
MVQHRPFYRSIGRIGSWSAEGSARLASPAVQPWAYCCQMACFLMFLLGCMAVGCGAQPGARHGSTVMPTTPGATGQVTRPADPSPDFASLAHLMSDEINIDRRAAGLSPVLWDDLAAQHRLSTWPMSPSHNHSTEMTSSKRCPTCIVLPHNPIRLSGPKRVGVGVSCHCSSTTNSKLDSTIYVCGPQLMAATLPLAM